MNGGGGLRSEDEADCRRVIRSGMAGVVGDGSFGVTKDAQK